MDKCIEEIFEALQESWLDEYAEFTEDDVEDFKEDYVPDVEWDYGASKLVFMPPESKFVIKIPFRGQNECVFGENDELLDYKDFCEFSGARDGWDYCHTELIIYNSAEEKELDQCFAKTSLIGKVKGYPIYQQEKAKIFGHTCNESEYSKEKTGSTEKKCKELDVNNFNSCWLSDFIDYYGNELFVKFMLFLKEMRINDLHRDNLGYINGRPVLVDYSGFMS